jgi:hypothetical protein
LGQCLYVFLFFNTQKCKLQLFLHSSIAMFPLQPYTLAGFEPGSSVPEADAMSTAPRRRAIFVLITLCKNLEL